MVSDWRSSRSATDRLETHRHDHGALPRLSEIKHPTLVLCGDHNFCTPLPISEEIAQAVPGAEFVVLEDAGELIELEKEEEFYRIVSSFIERHGKPSKKASPVNGSIRPLSN